jgi:hypothetical protein
MAMVDPSAATSALAETEGQQQISAFLNNDRQFQCLAEGIYFEARGEPRRGQVAVAQVIMNRVNHDEFPDTICGVVYQNQHWRNRCQFSFACDGVPERVTERAAWDMAEGVARQVLEGRDLIETIEESTHYHATYVRPRWAPRMIRLDRVGCISSIKVATAAGDSSARFGKRKSMPAKRQRLSFQISPPKSLFSSSPGLTRGSRPFLHSCDTAAVPALPLDGRVKAGHDGSSGASARAPTNPDDPLQSGGKRSRRIGRFHKRKTGRARPRHAGERGIGKRIQTI